MHGRDASRDLWLNKVPPNNIEAEESILSAILINNDALTLVLEILKDEDFYREAHRKIFRAMVALFDQSEPADLVTLTNYLREKGELESVGGASRLAEMIDTVPMAANVAHYAKIVQEKAVLRRLIERSAEITVRCFDDKGDVEDVLDFAQSAIFDISENKIKSSFDPLAHILTDAYKAVEYAYENRAMVTGTPSGFTDLDKMTSGFQPGDLIILAARPSMGKTALALNMCRHACQSAKRGTAFFSLEMSKQQLGMRMLSTEAKVDSSRIRGGFLSENDLSSINQACGVLYDIPMYIDDTPAISSLELRARARRLAMEKGIGLIAVDYLQLMRGPSTVERRDLEISEISRSLKALAKELSLPVIALSQLNRKVEERADKRPMLSDLRESGAIEQDADLILFIYRDEVYNKEDLSNRGVAELIISKQRNGPTGTVRLTYRAECTRFEDYQEGTS